MAHKRDKKPQLTAKQLKGIQAILTADSREQAAELAGVNRKTIYRWMSDEFFFTELAKAKKQIVQHGILKLQQSVRDAVATLTEICKNKDAPASSRVAAAREIVGQTLKIMELEELEKRISQVEKVLEKRKQS